MVQENRSGESVSPQISKMGVLDVSTGDFRLNESDGGFLIKNDGVTGVFLKVRLLGMSDTEAPIETRFDPGWNPEIVKFVEQTSVSTNLKYGY